MFYPNIPLKKLTSALCVYAKDAQRSDVLVLIDNTILGTSKSGITITKYAIYGYDTIRKKTQKLLLSDIEDASIEYRSGTGFLKLNGAIFCQIDLPGEASLAVIAEMLLKMSTAFNAGKCLAVSVSKEGSCCGETNLETQKEYKLCGESFSSSDSLQLNSADKGEDATMDRIIRKIIGNYSGKICDKYIFFSPDIPIKKLNNALKTYAKDLHHDDVLVLIDNSFFGNGKEGILVTEDMIYGRDNTSRKTRKFLLSDLENAIFEHSNFTGRLKLNGAIFCAINMPDKVSLRTLEEMFLQLSTSIKQGEYIKSGQPKTSPSPVGELDISNQATENLTVTEKAENNKLQTTSNSGSNTQNAKSSEQTTIEIESSDLILVENPEESQASISKSKDCPYCGETILSVAKKCKHCGEFFNAPPSHTSQSPNNNVNVSVEPREGCFLQTLNTGCGCFVIVVVLVVIFVIVLFMNL